MKPLEGIVPVLPTPLNEDGTPDPEGTQRLIDYMVDSGVHGLYVLGSVGEDMILPLSARVEVTKLMVHANNGRLPILVGAGTYGVQDALEFFDEVADLSIDGLHIIPYDRKLSDAATERFFTMLADASPFPLWMYHNPNRGKGIETDVAMALRDHPNIVGIKVAGYEYKYHIGHYRLQRDDFQCIGSGSSQFFSMMCLGGKAHTTSDAAAFPELFVDLYRTFLTGNLDAIRTHQFQLLDFLKRVPKGTFKDNGETTAECKFVLSLKGICQEYCAEPFRTLTDDEKQVIVGNLADYMKDWRAKFGAS